MIPIIEAEVVDKHKWIDREEFVDLIAVAQSCPGVFAANIMSRHRTPFVPYHPAHSYVFP